MKIFVPHSSNFNFESKLYLPLRRPHLNEQHTFCLPQEEGHEEVTKDLIKSCDLVLAEVSMPSTGQGIELGWADVFGTPIVCIHEQGSKISSSLHYITDRFIAYADPDDMIEKVDSVIGLLSKKEKTEP